MDPLSDVLRAVRLTGAYFYLVEGSSPWSVSTCAARELVPRVLPEAEHLVSYHVLVRGSCWGGVEGAPQVHMLPGDAILFPHGDPHLMSSDAGLALTLPALSSAPWRFPDTVRLGPSDDRDTALVCGFLGCDVRPFNPLVTALPRQLHVPGVATGWLSQFPWQAVTESRTARVGSETMLTRMAELMFVEVLRGYAERLSPHDTGWLAGLRDDVVGAAIGRLHGDPARAWTLADLAHDVATSRTVLAERFATLVGIPPMLYLTRWRLQLAAEQLSRGSAKVATVGAQVGYDSEAAFSRAFKRETGLSPAMWRRARQG